MKRQKLLPVLLLLLLQACVILDQVHDFSTNACEVLKSVKDLDYSFTKAYLKYEIAGNEFNTFLPDVAVDKATLQKYADADATLSLFANTLSNYFSGLGKLSDESTGKVDFSKLGDAIKGNDKALQLLHVTKDQVDAGVSLSRTIANFLTRHFKEREIKDIIVNTQDTVGIVLDALSSGLQNLQDNVGNSEILLKGKYARVTQDPGIEKGMRIAFVREYWQQIDQLEKQKKVLEDQQRGLKSLKQAVKDLAAQLKANSLSAKEVLTLLQQYSGELTAINDNIKKLVK